MTDQIAIATGAIVCADTIIHGQVTIGTGTVVHPQCRILAEKGPIVIGQNNILAECVTIINTSEEPLVIHNYNTFEVGSTCAGRSVGNHNVVEARGRILSGTVVGNHCVVGPMCATAENDTLEDHTVVFGETMNRRTQTSNPKAQFALYAKHLKYLQDLLPRYNHLRKATA
ncbi:hypothetical protein IWQ62_006540 [Dispira parvispora]|uniref:Dynactin subunit 6 n=1 Tax=Dispira parvispora TaxID=1520584 RepID=A0A9W8AGG8_9FUNG|nr:hypothetical protein IWQ62_006540 [Dispira parvispora]